MPADLERRTLRFATVHDAIAEAEGLIAAERAGRLDQLGNWSLGQALGHIATWAEFAHAGYPPSVRAPLPVRLILRLMLGRMLRDGLKPGVKLRKIPGGTLGIEPVVTHVGLARMRIAFQRLADVAPTITNPAFGKLTHQQWIDLNLRHAELHLSFHRPSPDVRDSPV